MKWLVVFFVFMSAFCFTACSTHNCSNLPQRPATSDSPPEAASNTDTTSATVDPISPARTETKPAIDPAATVKVFKDTGEKQCEEVRGSSLQALKAQLASKKITVLDSTTQPDGLMHMQMCGASKGNIHIITIAKKDLSKVTKLGFKELKLKK